MSTRKSSDNRLNWNVFDTQKKEIVAFIHTLGIGHNTLIDPQGHFAYLFPIKGGPGHWRRPSLGLPRTQPNEITVVDIRDGPIFSDTRKVDHSANPLIHALGGGPLCEPGNEAVNSATEGP